ncbi:hypothetical protein [Streptomyces sp. SAI-25]|uniref:hypothetical protein n=1 Tax=Streptomyces sp. SAI-25 TaxID=1472664 RepID=UPI00403A7B2F
MGGGSGLGLEVLCVVPGGGGFDERGEQGDQGRCAAAPGGAGSVFQGAGGGFEVGAGGALEGAGARGADSLLERGRRRADLVPYGGRGVHGAHRAATSPAPSARPARVRRAAARIRSWARSMFSGLTAGWKRSRRATGICEVNRYMG